MIHMRRQKHFLQVTDSGPQGERDQYYDAEAAAQVSLPVLSQIKAGNICP